MSCATKATTILLLLAALTCCHGSTPRGKKGGDECKLSDITVSLVKTGRVIEGQPQYKVTIANKCICPQFDIRLRCHGLPSVETVDKSKIVAVDREICLVAAGTLVFHDTPVVFTYAWKTPQSFTVASAKHKCALPS
ncbi:hypothetical protein PR202_ga21958 [Eleusine coracana subsp. coracana]|uniref:Uncharacterized protein n=1 Tax=Eleusine coracana subsp. coracana TaxID=191504 RepID=A0AAV5D1X7_ELECO|nr:hypothetical protein PR202_ga21958 [Eleusine coracana subsp. coracana]